MKRRGSGKVRLVGGRVGERLGGGEEWRRRLCGLMAVCGGGGADQAVLGMNPSVRNVREDQRSRLPQCMIDGD